MYQWVLLSEFDVNNQVVCLNNVKAIFQKSFDGLYDVVLEISSNKFFIKVSRVFDKIVDFEILAVKWFMEISRKVIDILRGLVDHLFCRID